MQLLQTDQSGSVGRLLSPQKREGSLSQLCSEHDSDSSVHTYLLPSMEQSSQLSPISALSFPSQQSGEEVKKVQKAR